MTIEVESREVKLFTDLQKDSSQNIIEGDAIVPDIKPDVISIIQADGKVKVNSKEVHKDMIVLRGIVYFNILYGSDDPSRFISSIDHEINFDQTIDIKTENSNIATDIEFDIEHIDCNVLNGRKVNVKAILNCYSKVMKDLEVSAISNVTGSEGIQMYSQKVNINKETEGENFESVVNWETEVPIGQPAIQEILKTDAAIKDKEIKVTGGKIVAKGNIDVRSLYVPDMSEKSIDFITNEVPFSEVIDFPELNSDKEINVVINIENVNVEVNNDEDGDYRAVNYEISLNFKPYYLEQQEFDLISDSYSVNSKLHLEKQSIKVSNIMESIQTQKTIKDSVQISGEEPQIKQLYNVLFKPTITEVNIEQDQVNIEGVIDTSVIYLTEEQEQPVKSYAYEIPFNNVIEIKGVMPDMNVEVKPEIYDYSCDMVDEKEIELKFVVTTFAKVLKEESYDIITNVEEEQFEYNIKELQPSMTVYYVQDDDTLWNIAKKYLTTIDELVKVNEISSSDSLSVGQQLLIPKVD